MAKEIKWTQEAEETYNLIIDYLEEKWTEKEVVNFISIAEKVLRFISQNPLLFRKSNKKHVHEVLITQHNLLLYRVKPKHIELITFFDTKQNLKKKHSHKR